MRLPASRRSILFVSLCASATCAGGGDVSVIEPPPAKSTRTTLTILASNGEDSAFATQLGWRGSIPGIVVTIAPGDTTLPPLRTLVSDSSGRVVIDSLTQGTYRVEAIRLLTDAERAKLPAASDLLGFARRTTMMLGGADVQASVGTYAMRRRGLLISEWSFVPGILPGVTGYDLGGYLELYNNGDSTVYLDGIMIVQGSAQAIETQPQSCAQAAQLFLDPLGIWARKFDQFPGNGHDYPLLPGQTVVIATDAIDHRPIIADGLDLRTAAFEFTGPADVDNPAVPNMIDRGLFADFSGHGTITDPNANVLALTPPLDLDALPRKLNLTGHEYRRVPSDKLLDAVAFRVYNSGRYPLCAQLVDPTIVRDQANLDYAADATYGFTHSVNRRVIAERNGRKTLEDTRSSTTDLIVASRTPNGIP